MPCVSGCLEALTDNHLKTCFFFVKVCCALVTKEEHRHKTSWGLIAQDSIVSSLLDGYTRPNALTWSTYTHTPRWYTMGNPPVDKTSMHQNQSIVQISKRQSILKYPDWKDVDGLGYYHLVKLTQPIFFKWLRIVRQNPASEKIKYGLMLKTVWWDESRFSLVVRTVKFALHNKSTRIENISIREPA